MDINILAIQFSFYMGMALRAKHRKCATLRRVLINVEEKIAEQKNAKLIFAKLHLIRKLKFHIFNFVSVILYLLFRMLSCYHS